jgi:RHH-type transcriptional regulator, proline utilization regulon repressor / proline dehydrogenase / delta 1-pyrroline-5-carboxylate dehydrogenase
LLTVTEVSAIETATRDLGEQILAHVHRGRGSVFHERWWDELILEWCMEDEALKTQIFRFVDVLPALRTHAQVADHVQAYFASEGSSFPLPARAGLDFVSAHSVPARAVAMAVRRNAQRMARRFIAGATLEEMMPELRRLWRQRMSSTVSLLGEATVSEIEADQYHERYLETLHQLDLRSAAWPDDALLEQGPAGRIPRVNVSVKLSALCPQIDPADDGRSAETIKRRLRPILQRAIDLGAFIYIDMEHHDYKNLILRVFREVLSEPEFARMSDVGIVLQAYLRETEADVRLLADWVKTRGAAITVRLVRGAYWDYETVVARLREWPVPVFQHKWETDVSYERLTELLLREYPRIHTALGTHNVRSLAHGVAMSRYLELPERSLELQMLYGMGDELKEAVVGMGQRMRVYVPYGELLPGMGYLVRRLLENTSDHSFLRMSFGADHSPEELLRSPDESRAAEMREALAEESPAGKETKMNASETLPPYAPEPLLDFAEPANRDGMEQALREVRERLGDFYPLVIGGKQVTSGRELISINPARPSEVIGRLAQAGQGEAAQAIAAARQAFPSWQATRAEDRARLLLDAAQELRRRRLELAAWEVFEVGKGWREADADIAEAIDFLEYYAREMLRLDQPVLLGNDAGERNEYFYQPRGVAVVIAPWNFPLAILTGMTSAALVTGNTVIMKPSEQSSVVAAKLMQVLQVVGVPDGVVSFLPGPGEEVGEYLVTHPDVSVIAFTGSREVGVHIYAAASQVAPGQRHLKKVIAELGGKNAIIVDEDADLDDAVLGVVASAFGFQGQKCSACSRAVVLDSIHDMFVSRLVEATKSVPVGPPENPGTVVGPLIDEDAYAKVRDYIAVGRAEGELVLETDVGQLGDGYFVGPAVFDEVAPDARIAQEEIFGPVLAVLRARDFNDALRIATGVDFALTGGLYSRHPEHIEQARREFRVGNLYINRKITGAVVGRQPFGGFGMSGIGSKAGGPDYLQQFLEPRTVTENTLRRGFAPEE